MISLNYKKLSHAEEVNKFCGMEILLLKGCKQGYFTLYRQCCFYFYFNSQVQNLTALVGKAFQVAFAESKFPRGTELKLEQFKTEASDKQIVQGRRWVCSCIKWLKTGYKFNCFN